MGWGCLLRGSAEDEGLSALSPHCSGAGSSGYLCPRLHRSRLKKKKRIRKHTRGYFPVSCLPPAIIGTLGSLKSSQSQRISVYEHGDFSNNLSIPGPSSSSLCLTYYWVRPCCCRHLHHSLQTYCATLSWANAPVYCWHLACQGSPGSNAKQFTPIQGCGAFSPSIEAPSANEFPKLSCLGSSSGPKQESELQGGNCLEGPGLTKKGTEQVDLYYLFPTWVQ